MTLPLPFLVYSLLINVTAFAAYGIDKRQAKRGGRRISEATLLLLPLFGGAMGAVMGMTTFRHKTKHKKFLILVPLTFLFHTAIWLSSLIFALLSQYGT